MAERTRFLSILCFLSGFNSIYGIISGLSSAISPPEVDQHFIDNLFHRLKELTVPIEGFQGEVEAYYLNLMLNLGNAGAANFLFFSIELIGVFLIYRLNRVGFTLYILAQLGLAFIPAVFGGFNTFGVSVLGLTILWNGLWVIMYWTQVRKFPKP